MKGTGYKLLGFVIWRGAKWFARHRLPSTRATAVGTAGALAALAAAAVIARRATS